MTADLRTLRLKLVYKSGEDDILGDFFVPCLRVASSYDRLAGFFSSSCFAVAAHGILSLVQRGGHMRIVCSPRLQKGDIEIINKSPGELQEVCTQRLGEEICEATESVVERDHLAVFAYMLARGLLEMRLVVPTSAGAAFKVDEHVQLAGLFHEKVGILRDEDGNVVSFSGSVNESAMAWAGNIEEFKVFRSWEPAQREYQLMDIAHFDSVWAGRAPRIQTFDLPTAIANKIVQIAPAELDYERLRKKYEHRKAKQTTHLFQYQVDAIERWFAADRWGILAMATGTGKTYTALGCIQKLEQEKQGFLCVISVPQLHLIDQWKSAIRKFPLGAAPIVVAGTNSNWRTALSTGINDLIRGARIPVIVVGTHASVSSPDFLSLVRRGSGKCHSLLVGDEVHRLGAPKYSAAMLKEYQWRLGLSATPDRWMDELGSDLIRSFFGETVFEFSLGDAIHSVNPATHRTHLVPYNLYPRFARLTDREMRDYVRLTQQIGRIDRDDPDPAIRLQLEQLYFRRARVLRDAAQKEDVLSLWIREQAQQLHHAIVYCSEKQIDYVCRHLKDAGISHHRFTMNEGVQPEKRFGGRTERETIINRFIDGTYRVLVAMKCLDEGVDIPQAQVALLLSNSSSPIEHIQRLGRLLRPCDGKNRAMVYDVVALPPSSTSGAAAGYSEALLKAETTRIRELASWADNEVEAVASVQQQIMGWGE
jgi:superfamily II DNA or RNA helicase